jgi:quercetin 2,3-dioxygenase
MIAIRRSEERGHARRGWLDSRHTFSFAEYYDPRHMAFRTLRVINEDRIAPGGGFGMHPHRDMEIVTWVLEGALEHRDSLGNSSVIRPGELQRMTAGTGIAHSEFNHSAEEPVHLLQIWILPEREGLAPGYEQRAFPEAGRRGRLQLVAAPDGRDGAVTIRQDAEIYLADLAAGEAAAHLLRPGRHAWLQVLRGEVRLNGPPLAAGDAAAVSEEARLEMAAEGDAGIMLFDLA